MPRLLAVNVGMPQDVVWQDRTVHTAIWKTPVKGPRMVRRLNIDGDGQGDLAGHGGEHRAVLVYQMESYRYWQKQLGRDDFVYGQFGENFTVEDLPDAVVCVGDQYRIGDALFEVTQPRVTCYRVGIRMKEPRMAALLVKHGRPGFYLRVLKEGEVEAGDEIERVALGPERMSVSEVDALLYMPGHPRDKLERALRIPALSAGWRKSFELLLAQDLTTSGTRGNAGLADAPSPRPAWSGFRPLRVSEKIHESRNVVSLVLEPADGLPMAAALAGQFVVLRFGSDSPQSSMRSYSLSGEPGASAYRVSIKREAAGIVSQYVFDKVEVGDIVEASAARGTFTLKEGDTPVVLLSAGIGVTPVLAMLHALAADASTREIWWLYGTRSSQDHPFADETRQLLKGLARYHSYVCYSSPDPKDRPHVDFDAVGHLNKRVLQDLKLPRDGDFYLCGPPSFMTELSANLVELGVDAGRIHTEVFGSAPSTTPGIAAQSREPPHVPAGPPGTGELVTFARSGLSVHWSPTFGSLLELAEACDVPVRWSCRTGVCHTCESGLVAGTICYQPDPVDAPADGNVLICCSQPNTDVVVDL